MLFHGGELLQGLSATLEEELVTEFLVGAKDAAQGSWNGKGDEVIGNVWDEFGLPFLGPIEPGLMTTEWAVAVIAGMIGKVMLPAFQTSVQGAAKRRRAASEDGLGGTTMLEWNAVTEACVVGTPVTREDFFEV